MPLAEPAPRWPLALRLLALGVVQLVVLGLAAFGIGELTRPAAPHDLTAQLDDVVSRVSPLLAEGGSPSLDETLRALEAEHGLELTVYDADRRVVATSSELVPLRGPARQGPPSHGLPPVGPPPMDGPRLGWLDPGGPRPPVVRALPGGHLLAARGEAPPRYLVPLLVLLVGLIVIAAGAFLTARWILAPLERLGEAARRVGQGDLAARTGLDRADELGTVARGFDRMAERVEDMMRSERELLANVSHELRTPLARLRVALDLASEGHTEALADVSDDLQELEAIVDDVLLAFRFERNDRAGRTGLPVGTLLETTMEELVAAARRRFLARHPTRALVVELEEGTPNVLADLAVLRRALDNLLDNADKYTPARDAAITLRVRRAGERVEISVEDHGVGIEPADQQRIFEPFFRAERSRVRSAGGVGLGLTLAKRIVEAHGGTLEVTSAPGVGTTMRVRLEAMTRPPSRSDT